VLEIEDLWVSYGPVEAIRGVSLRVSQGTVTAIVGANGAGKSTCLKAISGLVVPQKGAVMLDGAPIHRRPPEERLRLGIAHVLEGRRLFGDQSVEDNLVLGAYPNRHRDRWKAETLARCDEMYRRFPILGQRCRQQAVTLSGGEQMMLAIAVALMAQPRLLLLDEPSLGLAPKMVEAIGELVRELRRDGMTIVLVEQMASVALELADFGYAFQRGRVVLSGTGTEMLRDIRFREAYFGQDDAAGNQSSPTTNRGIQERSS
jgi:branched-chain amino acid transport system ATP-binding protein